MPPTASEVRPGNVWPLLCKEVLDAVGWLCSSQNLRGSRDVGDRSWGQVEGRSSNGRTPLRQQKRPSAGLFKSPLTDSNRRPPPYHRFSEVVRRSQWQRFTAWLGNSSRRISAVGFAGLRPLCSTTAPRFVVGSEDGQTRFLDEFAADGWARHAIATGRRDELLPVSSCGVLKQCGTVVRAGAVRPLGKEHEHERGCGEGNGDPEC